MSSSTSSFDLPEERLDAEFRAAQYAREQVWVRWLCRLSPLGLLILIPLSSLFLIPALFLKPIDWNSVSTSGLLSLKSLAPAMLITSLPWMWWLSLRWQSAERQTAIPVSAVLALLILIFSNAALEVPRVKWFFVEWAKLRTENPSFARNTLFWEQRDFESQSTTKLARYRVALVGSSQMYQSTDLTILTQSYDRWEKQCLAGFGPMQYPWLATRILERKPDVVICWLSEFDFYREETVPTSRLMWASTNRESLALLKRLTPKQAWSNRGEFADLLLAANIPIWRQRDHFRRTLFNYWWNVSRPKPGHDDNAVVLAASADLSASIENLRQNVKRTSFVEVNFESFAAFAQQLKQHDIELVVFEGQLHPATHVAYDPAYHAEVDQRLQKMASEPGFRYIHGDALCRLTADEFADGYHTNEDGRTRWSNFILQTLAAPNSTKSADPESSILNPSFP